MAVAYFTDMIMEKNLKLDAITGDVYDVATRQKCKRINHSKLSAIQGKLRNSKDFHDKVVTLIDARGAHDGYQV